MIRFQIFVYLALTFITIRGEICNWFESTENIAVDPSTCRMETSVTPDWIHRCAEKCGKNLEVRCVNNIFHSQETLTLSLIDPI